MRIPDDELVSDSVACALADGVPASSSNTKPKEHPDEP